jgi:hypothetical protein
MRFLPEGGLRSVNGEFRGASGSAIAASPGSPMLLTLGQSACYNQLSTFQSEKPRRKYKTGIHSSYATLV